MKKSIVTAIITINLNFQPIQTVFILILMIYSYN